jgi:hypothetical protein
LDHAQKIVATCTKFECDEGALRSRKQAADTGRIAALEIFSRLADDMKKLDEPLSAAYGPPVCVILRATSITREKIKMAVRRTGASMVLAVGICGLQLAISAPALAQGKRESQGLQAGYEKPFSLTTLGNILLKREST